MKRHSYFFATAAVVAMLSADAALAQKDQQHKQHFQSSAAMRVPASEGLIELQASMPSEVKAGENFTYKVIVSNVSDDVVLHDIELKTLAAEGLSIDSARLQTNRSASSESQKESAGSKSSKNINRKTNQDSQKQTANASQKSAKGQETSSGLTIDGDTWTIDKLMPAPDADDRGHGDFGKRRPH